MPKLNVTLYKKLYLIRRAEEKIQENYFDDEMKTPMHMSMGSEAISVGVCQAMAPDDQVLGSYRSHALYLAKTDDTNDFFAEMYGKDTAFLKGKGGSMHMCAPRYGFMGTSAIVASSIPVAVGLAFANKHQGTGKMTAVFFGDGAIDEGNFWESLNVACLMKLPILLVCEDNGFAVHTPASIRHGYRSITDIVSRFNCKVIKADTTDVESIYRLTKRAIKMVKDNQMPCFMHLKYYRYLEHVGVSPDYDAGYRSRDEFEEWYKRDPVKLQREKLLRQGVQETEVSRIEEDINNRIDKSLSDAQSAPFADTDELFKDVLA